MLSYTEIMALLQVTNTGRLNYHLKVLGDLISKDDEGKYRLTERGKLAVSLLKTFPERVPVERNLSALKIAVAVVLMLVGVLFFVVAFSIVAIGLTSPAMIGSSQQVSMSSQVITQNTTISLTSWVDSGTPFSISWSASSPVYVYVLNKTQYVALLLQHTTGGQAPLAVLNFTGAPTSWVGQYYHQTGNASLSLPQGQYFFFAGSNTRAVLDTFDLRQTQQPQQVGASSQSPFIYLFLFVFIAFGTLLIVLAFSILTRRVWH